MPFNLFCPTSKLLTKSSLYTLVISHHCDISDSHKSSQTKSSALHLKKILPRSSISWEWYQSALMTLCWIFLPFHPFISTLLNYFLWKHVPVTFVLKSPRPVVIQIFILKPWIKLTYHDQLVFKIKIIRSKQYFSDDVSGNKQHGK